MKALVLVEYGKLGIREVPTPQPGPGEVLVRVEACGICGSDVHGLDGSTGRRIPPLIMGHEAAGTIADLGAGVDGWTIGQAVAFDSLLWCGQCEQCRSGKTNLCDHREVLGVACSEFRRDGAFAQFVVVPARLLEAIPPGVSHEKAALVEPIAVAIHAVRRLSVQPHERVLVIGAGVIGLLVIQVLQSFGCKEIWVADIDGSRLELARRLGARYTLDATPPNWWEEILARTAGKGLDHAIDAVGAISTVSAAVHSVRKGGSVALIGNLRPEVPLPLQRVVTREMTLLGCCASAGEYTMGLKMIAERQIDPTPLISAVVSLERAPEYFRRLTQKDPNLIKVVVKPWEE